MFKVVSFDTPQGAAADPPAGHTALSQAAALPRLGTCAAGALSRLYSGGGSMALDIRGQPHVLQWDFQRAIGSEQRCYRFTIGQHVGYVGVDFLAEAALLGGERHADLLPRELRYLLLADALHPLVQHVQRLLGLRFEWDPPERNEELVRAAQAEGEARFRVDDAAGVVGGGFIRFGDSTDLERVAAALSSAPAPVPVMRRSLEHLRFPVSLVLGTTRIALQAVRQIGQGDVIAIETTRRSRDGLRVEARVEGARGIEIQALAEASRITIQSWSESTMTQVHDDPPSVPPGAPVEGTASGSASDAWDRLEMLLRFEVGDLSMSLSELRSLQPGHVFDLKHSLDKGEVRILAHGRRVGSGYLVAVGDHLGVRVTQFSHGGNE